MNGGNVITVCEYAEFNHSFLALNGTQEVLLAGSIQVPAYAFIGASVRVHARNLSAITPAGFEVLIRQSNPSRLDPADFSLPALSDALTPKITNTTNPATVPGLVNLTTPVTQAQNPFVKVLLKSYAPASGPVSLWIIISVDLIVRTSV